MQFTDGSIYERAGVSLEHYLTTWASHLDPGCAANGAGVGQKSSGSHKLSAWPLNAIHEAIPNDYTPK